jgi:hypothetical protein
MAKSPVAAQRLEDYPADFSPQSGGAPMVRPMAGVERVFGAQQVQVYRDEQKVLAKMKTLAAGAGTDWFYRYPVRKKVKNEETGREEWGTDWIEGPSIKLANNLARVYGNCDIDTRMIDIGEYWLLYARFIDLETGFSMTRPYQQRKAQISVNTKDPQRAMDIALQIGVSKAIRNVIVNALETFANHAFEEARNSLVERIEGDIDRWRTRTIEGLGKIPVSVKRAELVMGRAAKDWLAPDIARVISMMQAIADGMATVNETFPDPDAKPEPETKERGAQKSAFDEFAGADDEEATKHPQRRHHPGKPKHDEGDEEEGKPDEPEHSEPAPEAKPETGEPTPPQQPQPPADPAAPEPPKKPAPDIFDNTEHAPAVAGPPTNAAEYKAFAKRIIDDANTAEEATALHDWFDGERQRRMRASCHTTTQDIAEIEKWIATKIAKVTKKK